MEIFTEIYSGMVNWFGLPWIVWVLLFVGLLLLIVTLLQIDLILGLMVTSLPLIVFSIYQTITLGAWGLSLVVIILGLGLAFGLGRLLIR